MDDIPITRNYKEYVNKIKGWLSSNFEIQDIGEASYILKVKISKDCSRKILSLSQESYFDKIFK